MVLSSLPHRFVSGNMREGKAGQVLAALHGGGEGKGREGIGGRREEGSSH